MDVFLFLFFLREVDFEALSARADKSHAQASCLAAFAPRASSV